MSTGDLRGALIITERRLRSSGFERPVARFLLVTLYGKPPNSEEESMWFDSLAVLADHVKTLNVPHGGLFARTDGFKAGDYHADDLIAICRGRAVN